MRTHDLVEDQTQGDPFLGLRREGFQRQLRILGLDPAALELVRRPVEQGPRLYLDQRSGNGELRPRAKRAQHLALEHRLDLALELELEVTLDLRAQLVEAAAGDAEILGKLGVDNWQPGLAYRMQLDLELRPL